MVRFARPRRLRDLWRQSLTQLATRVRQSPDWQEATALFPVDVDRARSATSVFATRQMRGVETVSCSQIRRRFRTGSALNPPNKRATVDSSRSAAARTSSIRADVFPFVVGCQIQRRADWDDSRRVDLMVRDVVMALDVI